MNQKHLSMVENAFRLFIHYGVNKTSMTEIAAAAQVARQTLYKAFDSKEDLIFAALLHYSARTKSDVETGCTRVTDLSARLDVVFEHMGLVPYQAMQTYPHLDEVLEIADSLSDARKAQIKANYTEAVGVALAPWEKALAANGVDLTDLCDLVKSVFSQIKRDARDDAHLAALFAPLKSMILKCAS